MKRWIALLMLVFAFACNARADEKTSSAKPAGSFEVVEWLVLNVDSVRPMANEAAAFRSTLPGFARGRRTPGKAALPTYIAVAACEEIDKVIVRGDEQVLADGRNT